MKSLEAFTLKQLKEVLGLHKQYHNIENIVSACTCYSLFTCSIFSLMYHVCCRDIYLFFYVFNLAQTVEKQTKKTLKD